ncbi:MAG TPA: class I SAM-dependent RNA methyltransferase [Chloroflexia bacterium]|nr:class I SAM-dependent RNA methyltransferase [Chloroflexia bacterium]
MNERQAPARVRFTGMAYGGDAVGRDPESGIAVFGWPAIEGETAVLDIVSRGKSHLRGVVTSLEEAAPSRRVPPCPYFGACGGCQWQHIAYEQQVAFKHDILRSQLARLGGIADPDAILREPVGSPAPYGYRNTSHFALSVESRTVGYHRRDSHGIIPVLECPISSPGINAVLPFVNSVLAMAVGPGEPAPERGAMQVWKVSVRASDATGHTLLVFHSRSRTAPTRSQRGRHRPVERPEQGPTDVGADGDSTPILLTRREVRRAVAAESQAGGLLADRALIAVEVMDDGTVNRLGETRSASSAAGDALADVLGGSQIGQGVMRTAQEGGPPLGAWVERLAGRHYWVAPDAFFQANTPVAERMLAEVIEHVGARGGAMIDAHAGVGTFSIAIAEQAAHVYAFETDSAAVHSARWNASAHNLRTVSVQQGRAEQLLPRLAWSVKLELALLDPPRAGCHPALLTELGKREVPRIIYVSCDPSTLARDIKVLAPKYRLVSARMFDMFPQTYHIETVAVLDLVQ